MYCTVLGRCPRAGGCGWGPGTGAVGRPRASSSRLREHLTPWKKKDKKKYTKKRNLSVFWEIRLLPALFFPDLGCSPFAGIKTGGKRCELGAGGRRRGAAPGFGALLSPGRWVRPRSSRSEIRLKRPKITPPAAASPPHTPLTRAALCLRQVPYALTLTI